MAEPLKARLEADLKAAMKSGDVLDRDTIRFVLADIKNAEIDQRGPLDEVQSLAVLQRQAKRMSESIDQYLSGGRVDLAERESAQLAIVKRYMPIEMSDEELLELARQVVVETGAATPKDMGRVMPILIERAGGRADGKRLSAAAKTAITHAGS
jgi:uncharacterized protein YqeY